MKHDPAEDEVRVMREARGLLFGLLFIGVLAVVVAWTWASLH